MASGSNSFLGEIRSRLPRKRPHSNSDPPDLSPNDPGGQSGTKSTSNETIKALKSALGILQGGLNVFPPLKSAIDELVECTTYLQIADHNISEYERLAADLATLAHSLQARLSRSKPTHTPFSVQNVARAIKELAQHIQLQRDRSRTRRFAAEKEDEDGILECYRRVAALFEQLQVDISLCIWDVVREQQMNAYLKDLLPADDAYYNSALPAATTKRRACTENTRTQVLTEAHNWTRDEFAVKIYWMNGMAGTGKTTIAYSLCKRLEEDKQLGASFFCSRDSPTCRDVHKIVPTIAYQLARYSNPFRQALCDILSNDPDVAKKNLATQFGHLIAKPLGGVKEAIPRDLVVVIDALDECADIDGTKDVLNLLFRHASELPIKFFVTSRPEPAIANNIARQHAASRAILHLHEIEDSFVQADIRTYLEEALAPIRPSAAHVEQIVAQAGRLFIFAATVVRYISPDDGSADHEERLSIMLGGTSNLGDRDYEDIDSLYSMILSSALGGGKKREKETTLRRRVLWTVVCAREPMTTSAIAELIGVDTERKVDLAIQPLRSVLNMSGGSQVVSTLHASFPEFLLSEERAGSLLYCNRVEHHSHLATRCFEVMKRSLRFNICELETSYRFDKDVPGLEDRLNKAISLGLFYACRYWADHLSETAVSSALQSCLAEFLRYRLLFWMEVVNLKRWMSNGDDILFRALKWSQTDDGSTELRQFTHDARNFVTTFAANPTSLSTPHIYLSVLPFTSNQSHVRKTYWPRMRGLLRVDGTWMEARGSVALATWDVGSEVMSIAQSSDGKLIVSGSSDGTVSIWDVASGTRIVGPLQSDERGGSDWAFRHQRSYGPHVAFSLDGEHIACGSIAGTIRLWDAHTGNLITGLLDGHAGPILSVTSSPVEPLFASGSEDHTIRVWNMDNGIPLGEPFRGHQGPVLSVAFSSDGKRLASGSSDMKIRVWDPHTGTMILGPLGGHTDWVRSVAFSRDGLRIVSGSDDKTVLVWDAQGSTILAVLFGGHTDQVLSVAFSPDGMQVASGSEDNTICIWDSQNGTLLAGPLEGHLERVNSVLFSPDGTRILSGSDDGAICVWDVHHGTTAAAKPSGHTSTMDTPVGSKYVSMAMDDQRNPGWTLTPLLQVPPHKANRASSSGGQKKRKDRRKQKHDKKQAKRQHRHHIQPPLPRLSQLLDHNDNNATCENYPNTV